MVSDQIVWATLSRSDRRKIRREMLVQAEKMLAGQYANKAKARQAARTLVDMSIAREMRNA